VFTRSRPFPSAPGGVDWRLRRTVAIEFRRGSGSSNHACEMWLSGYRPGMKAEKYRRVAEEDPARKPRCSMPACGT
jgi:hypothetical protein